MNLFEIASRNKFRFESSKGFLTSEDLWDLPLTGNASLDEVAKGVNRSIKNSEEESFVNSKPTNVTDRLKLDLVKHIIAIRLQEKNEAQEQLCKKQKKEKILRILEEKENEELKNVSSKDLLDMLNNL